MADNILPTCAHCQSEDKKGVKKLDTGVKNPVGYWYKTPTADSELTFRSRDETVLLRNSQWESSVWDGKKSWVSSEEKKVAGSGFPSFALHVNM